VHTITAFTSWTCYGQSLREAKRGAVDPERDIVDTPWSPPNVRLKSLEQERMTQPPYSLDVERQLFLFFLLAILEQGS
jgi:hypothetical protein